MPRMIILVGPPAAGKSTWREKFLAGATEEWVIASTDDLIDAWAAEHGMTYNEAHPKAPWGQFNKTFKYTILNALGKNQNIIVDRTSMSVKNRKEYFKNLPEGYELEAVVFVVPQPELERRMKDRFERTGKSVPLVALLGMNKRYEAPSKEEGFTKITYVRP